MCAHGRIHTGKMADIVNAIQGVETIDKYRQASLLPPYSTSERISILRHFSPILLLG